MSIFVCKITNWSYGYFIMTSIREGARGVLSGVGVGKKQANYNS